MVDELNIRKNCGSELLTTAKLDDAQVENATLASKNNEETPHSKVAHLFDCNCGSTDCFRPSNKIVSQTRLNLEFVDIGQR